MGYLTHILEGGVGAGTDTYLVDLYLADLLNGLHVVRAVRTSSKRNQLGKVDVNFLVVNCVVVSGERNVVLFPALSLQELECSFIGREYGSGSAKLGAPCL